MNLGDTIRSRRTALGLSLEALAERSNVSRAMLSGIERGTKNPTVKVAAQIAKALNCTISELLGESERNARDKLTIVHHNERRVLVDPQSGVERHQLSPMFERRGIEVLWYSIPSGKTTGPFPPHLAGIEEHITVVQGTLHCCLNTEEIILQAGDSISFQADIMHEFHNPGSEPCCYFLIIDSSRTRSAFYSGGHPQ